MEDPKLENTKKEMRKGFLEYCILLIISKGRVYASDILEKLKNANLIVVEGTLYPLLSRLKKDDLVDYYWQESRNGPPRKYYSLTKRGQNILKQLNKTWEDLSQSIKYLNK